MPYNHIHKLTEMLSIINRWGSLDVYDVEVLKGDLRRRIFAPITNNVELTLGICLYSITCNVDSKNLLTRSCEEATFSIN